MRTIGRHARIALAVVVVSTLGANVAVLTQRGSATVLATRAPRGVPTTSSEVPALQEGTAVSDPGPVTAAAPGPVVARDASVPHGDSPRARNIPDKAPVPKAAPSTKPIVGLLDGPEIEGYARYEGQSTCDPTPKPGTVALRNLLLSRYPNTVSFGISRACDVGGVSEHKEGRAFDWGANVNNPAQRAAVDNFLAALFATDSYGHRHALARRMGVMYVIWNQQIWGAYKADTGWQPYSGDSPHTDHVHISLSWAGARAETSYYSGHVVPGLPDVSPPAPRSQGPQRPPTSTSTSTTVNRRRPPSTTTTRPSTTTTTRPRTTTTTPSPTTTSIHGP
ncbi:MAG: hypothetical protein JWP02_2359 [Acidimicrobiales bacterium]|nr:hypothetical protein [Acidimicrobiales bacterium]